MSKVRTTPTALKGPSPDFSSPLSTPYPRTRAEGVPLSINRHLSSLNEPPPPTGVDKLTLTIRDFGLRDVTKSGLKASASTDYGTGEASGVLIIDDTGRAVHADKLYTPGKGPLQIDVNRNGLKVEFCPSKLFTPSDGGLLCNDPRDLRAAVNLVKQELHRRGLRCDLDDARIYRLDLTRDVNLRNPFGQYVPVFGAISLKRHANQATHPGGFTSTRGTLGFILYNKGAEAGLNRDDLARGELQFKKHDGAPLKRSGVYSIRSLHDVGFDGLHELYAATMRANVFTAATLDDLGPSLPSINLSAELAMWRATFGRGYYLKWVAANGVTSALELYTLDQIAEALTASGMSRAQVKRAKLYTRDLLHRARRTRTAGHLAKLYDELFTALASA